MALRSRELWLELLQAAQLPYRPTGSLHAVYRDDEAAVAREFAEIGPGLGVACCWLNPAATLEKSHALNPAGLIGALWSPTELTVDPRITVGSLPRFLAECYGVEFHFASPVGTVESLDASTVIVCSGDDFATLYPELFAASPVTRCKLQMLRTAPQPSGWELGPSLAAGLTLRFYAAFGVCTTLPALKQRIADETPEYDRYGIHVLVSQTGIGELTLGDSHEYGRALDIFDKTEIDELILRYLHTFLRAPKLNIAERWHGVYATHPSAPYIRWAPDNSVRIVTAPGGSGMTLSFGLAEGTLAELGL